MIFYRGEVVCGGLNVTWIAFGLHAGFIASAVLEAWLGRTACGMAHFTFRHQQGWLLHSGL